MKEYWTSFILSKGELLLLLSGLDEVQPLSPAKYVIREYLSGNLSSEEAVDSLVDKKLGRKTAGGVKVEPVISLLARAILTADRLWILSVKAEAFPVLIMRAENIFVVIQGYMLIKGALKIACFKSSDDIPESLINKSINEIRCIDKTGYQRLINNEGSLKWLKEE